MADLIYWLLRSAHIITGALWVGFGIVTLIAVNPIIRNSDYGHQFARDFYAHGAFSKVIPWLAISTTVAGLILYAPIGTLGLAQQLGGIGHGVLGIGALAGLAAFGHGIAVGSITGKYKKMVTGEVETTEDEINAQEDKLVRNARISAYITFVAITFMSLARYAETVFNILTG